MKKFPRILTFLLLTLIVGLLSSGAFALEPETVQAVSTTASVTRTEALMSEQPALVEGQYTEVPIDDPAPGNELVGVCTFNPETEGYYRIQFTSASSSATVAQVDSDDTVSNALREDFSVKEWTIYGVFKLEPGTNWYFEINAPYDSMQVLITKENVEWTTELPEELPVPLYETANLYAGFRLPSQKNPGSYYSVSAGNFPANVAEEKIEVVSGGEYIELEQVKRTNSGGWYYKITGIAPGTAILRLSTTYCGQTKISDIQVNVTDLIVKASNITDEMELGQYTSITPEMVVYHRDGTINSYRDIETDAFLTYTYLSEGTFQYKGQTVKALSVDGNGCFTAEYPGFGIMMIEAYENGNLIAELGYNIIVTAAPNCGESGHSYDDGVVTTSATCTAAGKKTYTCTVCRETKVEPIAALGHSYTNGVVTEEPKYLTTGTITYSCIRCRETKRQEIPVLAVPFTDVSSEQFYYTPMLWALDKGITTGVTNTTFEPNSACTRAHVVTFLWRAAGSPEPLSDDNPFTDVKAKDYFYKAVLWAYENGITTGMTSTSFDPKGECTRGQVATFLWRLAKEPEPQTTTNPFKDISAGAYYYKAVLWAYENKITNGVSATNFGPEDTCTRGQAVTFLHRLAMLPGKPPVY